MRRRGMTIIIDIREERLLNKKIVECEMEIFLNLCERRFVSNYRLTYVDLTQFAENDEVRPLFHAHIQFNCNSMPIIQNGQKKSEKN